MAFLLFFNRTMYLTNYVNNLQTKINDITTEKLEMSETIAQYTSDISDLGGDKNSPSVQKLMKLKADLEVLEKKLDAKLAKYNAQLQAAQTELQAANNALQQSTQRDFSPKYFAA